jgi:hypothetical protein
LDPSERAHALMTARLIAAVLGAGPFLLLAVALAFPPSPSASPLVVPAGVLGLVAPAIAWRVQARVREGVGGAAAAGRRAYVRSVTVGLAITEAAAVLGLVVWLVSGQASALTGLPMHLVMVGALWPTEERLQRAEEEAGR